MSEARGGWTGRSATDLARELRNIPFHLEGSFTPHYYQELAVHAATDAIGNGKDRALLTLATGTGKTKTLQVFFNICWVVSIRWIFYSIQHRNQVSILSFFLPSKSSPTPTPKFKLEAAMVIHFP